MRPITFAAVAAVGFVAAGLTPAIGQSDRATAKGELTVRASPPSPLFKQRGSVVGTLEKGEQVVVEDRLELRGLFGSEQWVKVRPPSGQLGWTTGWVYNGEISEGNPYLSPENHLGQ